MIVVLDTNVLISSQLTRMGYEYTLLTWWKQGHITGALSQPLLDEYQRVLTYPRIQARLCWSDADRQSFIDDLRQIAIVVPGITPVHLSVDPDDNMLFACALEAQAEFIVSGDKQHVLSIPTFQSIQTISPKGFVETVLHLSQERKVA